MLKSLIFPVTGLLLAVASATADDSLLSDVRIDSVFESDSDSSESAIRPTTVRVRDREQLSRLLRDAGFEVNTSGDRTIRMRKKLAQWSFPVFVAMSEDEKQIEITFALSSVKDVSEVNAEKLLELMESNRRLVGSQFLFSKARKRTELFSLVQNDRLTAQILRDEINRLAVLAKDNAGLWKIGKSIPSEDDADTSEKASPEEAAPAESGKPLTGESLTGNWSAAKSATEAFALRFNSDGTFVLVYVKNGQQTRSTGKFTLENRSLSLTGSDGLKLTGTLTQRTEQEFRFQPDGSAVLAFKKAN